MTVMNTDTWRSLFEYQRLVPGLRWERFHFEVKADESARQRTRFQIWYNGAGTLWLSDVRMEPITDPTEGRWLEGLYLDVPEQRDDPYRFFRWQRNGGPHGGLVTELLASALRTAVADAIRRRLKCAGIRTPRGLSTSCSPPASKVK